MLTLRELLDAEYRVPFDIEGHTLTFHFRNANADEEKEYIRRTSLRRVKENGVVESTDAALNAPLWLFNKLCTRITLKNGTGEAVEVSKEETVGIPGVDQYKLEAIGFYRNRYKKKEVDDLSD
jgi:hypothetical protein